MSSSLDYDYILPIKKLWFDMILSGEKLEEYREIKTYYRTRFFNKGFLDSEGKPTDRQEWILFRNGYFKSSPSFMAYCQLSIKEGNPEWAQRLTKGIIPSKY